MGENAGPAGNERQRVLPHGHAPVNLIGMDTAGGDSEVTRDLRRSALVVGHHSCQTVNRPCQVHRGWASLAQGRNRPGHLCIKLCA